MAIDAFPDIETNPDTIRREDGLSQETGEFLYSKFSWVDKEETAWFGRSSQIKSDDLTTLDLRRNLKRLPDEAVYPIVEEWMTIAEDTDQTHRFIKRPNIQRFDDVCEAEYVPQKLRDEIIALERIKQHHPYPDYVGYYGCTVKRGRVTSIVQEKFSVTLKNRHAENPRPLDVAACMRSIRASIRFLHGHGLAHNDVTPENIGMTAEDKPVILNFGCCKIFGEKLVTGGTDDVDDPDYGESSRNHDENAMSNLERLLFMEEELRRN